MAFRTEEKSKLSFGIWVPPLPPYARLHGRWPRFEAMGYESLWMIDHFTNPVTPVCPWLEAWTLLAAMAASTQTIRIGTLVTSIIYRSPALTAKQALTVDHISGGRLIVGLGAGSARDLGHPMSGVPAWPAGERVSRFEEFVAIVDHMLSNQSTTYHGKYYSVEEALMLPGPVQQPRPPLLIGAAGERMLKIAAQYADTWNGIAGFQYTPQQEIEATRQQSEKVSEYAASLGRDPAAIKRSLCVGWTRAKPFESISAFQDYIGRYIEIGITEFVFGYWDQEDIALMGEDAPMQHITDERTLEWVSAKALPGLMG